MKFTIDICIFNFIEHLSLVDLFLLKSIQQIKENCKCIDINDNITLFLVCIFHTRNFFWDGNLIKFHFILKTLMFIQVIFVYICLCVPVPIFYYSCEDVITLKVVFHILVYMFTQQVL
jgi:hypothetical protein